MCPCFFRCKECIAAGRKDDIDVKVDCGKWYEKKLRELCPDTVHTVKPTVLPIFGWKDFYVGCLPSLFNYGHIYHWLVESMPTLSDACEESGDDDDNNCVVTEKPLRRGEQYVTSGNVKDVKVKVADDAVHFKALVEASMKKTGYNVTASLSPVSGAVRDASCHCKASALSRCSHVAALLLCMSKYVGERAPACTDLPCKWKKGKKKTPSSINRTVYKSDTVKKTNVIRFDPRPTGSCVSSQQVNTFISDLATANANTNCTSMWVTVLQMSYEDYDLTAEQQTLLSCLTTHLLENLTPAITVPSAHSCMVSDTVDQAASTTWQSHRYLRMTASTAKEAVFAWRALEDYGKTAAVSARLYKFLRRKVWGLDCVMTKYMRMGVENEEHARNDYARMNPTFRVEKTGLWVVCDNPQLGCSPDGLVCDPSAGYGLLEVKCLKLLQDFSPSELLQAAKSGNIPSRTLQSACFRIVNNQLVLRTSHAYYYQVQYQLGVSGFKWCDFVFVVTEGASIGAKD